MIKLISQVRTPTDLTSAARKSAAADYWQVDSFSEILKDENGEPFIFGFADNDRVHNARARSFDLTSKER